LILVSIQQATRFELLPDNRNNRVKIRRWGERRIIFYFDVFLGTTSLRPPDAWTVSLFEPRTLVSAAVTTDKIDVLSIVLAFSADCFTHRYDRLSAEKEAIVRCLKH